MNSPSTPDTRSLQSSTPVEPITHQHILVCQNRTCVKQGAIEVLTAFQAHPVPGYIVTKAGCMGQCGNGPMVRILPDNIWYCRVRPEEVPDVVERHLRGGRPVRAMLSPHFHADLRQRS